MGYQKFLICCALWFCLGVRIRRGGARGRASHGRTLHPAKTCLYCMDIRTVRCGTICPAIETSGLFGMTCLDFRIMASNICVIGPNGLHKCPRPDMSRQTTHCSQAHASLNLLIIIPIPISNPGARAHRQKPPLITNPPPSLPSPTARLLEYRTVSYDTLYLPPYHQNSLAPWQICKPSHLIPSLPYRPTSLTHAALDHHHPNSPNQNLLVKVLIKILGGCDHLSPLPGTFPFTIPIRLGVIGDTE